MSDQYIMDTLRSMSYEYNPELRESSYNIMRQLSDEERQKEKFISNTIRNNRNNYK